MGGVVLDTTTLCTGSSSARRGLWRSRHFRWRQQRGPQRNIRKWKVNLTWKCLFYLIRFKDACLFSQLINQLAVLMMVIIILQNPDWGLEICFFCPNQNTVYTNTNFSQAQTSKCFLSVFDKMSGNFPALLVVTIFFDKTSGHCSALYIQMHGQICGEEETCYYEEDAMSHYVGLLVNRLAVV